MPFFNQAYQERGERKKFSHLKFGMFSKLAGTGPENRLFSMFLSKARKLKQFTIRSNIFNARVSCTFEGI
jgi:hypothetical protein